MTAKKKTSKGNCEHYEWSDLIFAVLVVATSLTLNESHNIQWTCQVSLIELKFELLLV